MAGRSGCRVEIAPLARRQIRKLPREAQRAVEKCTEGLALAPRPFGVPKLAGVADLHRVRVGNYRIVYQINDREFIVLVVKAGDRRERESYS